MYLWLVDELVELCQFIQGEMSLDLLLIHNTGREALFRHLAVIDLFLHRALGQKPVDVNGLLLSKPEKNPAWLKPVKLGSSPEFECL